MKPYYDEDGITLYHGDCREILPGLEAVDLVVSDPPYPGLKGNMKSRMGGGVSDRSDDQQTVGLPWGDDLSPIREAWEKCTGGMMLFCSFHSVASLPQMIPAKPVGLVTWYKRNSMPPVRNVPHYQTEFVWAYSKGITPIRWRNLKTFYDFPLLQGGCMAVERILNPNGSTAHPTQKPLALMLALLAVGGDSILDPYAGTGTTLIAAKLAGRRAIGIEIELRYCEISANRLRQGVLWGPEVQAVEIGGGRG